MSFKTLRREIRNAIDDEGIVITEVVEQAISDLLEVLSEEEDERELDTDEDD